MTQWSGVTTVREQRARQLIDAVKSSLKSTEFHLARQNIDEAEWDVNNEYKFYEDLYKRFLEILP